MRSLYSSFSVLFAALIAFTACSKNQIAQTSEVDDMYFTSEDRAELEASTKVYTENFRDDYQQPLTEDQAEEYSDINYSSKTVNPEYIAKYSSEELNTEENLEADGEYYEEYYDDQYEDSDANDNYYVRNNYYGSPYSYGNPYSVWDYDPWFYTSPYAYYPYGSRVSISFSYGWGSRWYSPYSYYNRGFYDPFWGPRYPRYYSGYYNPGGWNSWYGPSYYGAYYGFGNSYYYCPSYIAPSYFYSDNRYVATRDITRGPRVSRGAALPGNGNPQYRGTGNGVRVVDDGSVATRRNGTSNSRSTGARNNYYRRTRTTSDEGVTRGTQSYDRSANTRTSVTPTQRRTYNSGYSRSSQSSYRTSSSRNNSRYSTGTNSRSSSGTTYRRSTGNTRSRTSGTTFRSNTGSRSSSSVSTGSRSSGSRSSGTSSRSSSGSSSRSSSGSSRRGGN